MSQQCPNPMTREKETVPNGLTESDEAMLKFILEEVRHFRQRLDKHIEDEPGRFSRVQDDITKIREDLATNKGRVAAITSGIALVVAGAVSYFFRHFGGS